VTARGPWVIFEDETGTDLRPPRARTWGRRGCIPVVRVRGGSRGKASIAGLVRYRPGSRSRLLYRLKVTRRRPGDRASFSWQEYRDLLVGAHHQFNDPIVVIWDNLNVHMAEGMKEFIEANQSWLQVVHLPTYALDLNPTEGIWSLLKRSLGNRATANLDDLAATIKRRLKKLQYRPSVIDSVLAETDSTWHPPDRHHEFNRSTSSSAG